MTMQQFDNIGYAIFDLTKKDLEPIKKEINKIQDNFSKAILFNNNLAGNIEKEYLLTNSKQYIQDLILNPIQSYENYFGIYTDIVKNHFSKTPNLILENVWVNFQKKYEFNPPHTHKGVYSFVIWIDMPFFIENELNNTSVKNSNLKLAGNFQFIYSNSLGKINFYNIPADKSYNGKVAIFPSSMAHCVYPFYTSDKYRISVSGNFVIDGFQS